MRLRRVVALLGLAALAPGCTPLANVARVVLCEPAAYCLHMDECVSHCRNLDLAEEAWAQFESALPDACYSDDFADGFKAGFADFLWAGGNGDPPVVPPRQYWKPQYESPQGQQMMQDWFRGFRHGAAVARESGYRDVIMVPASAGLSRTILPVRLDNPAQSMPVADDPTGPMPKQLPPAKNAAPAQSISPN
jgi:hypothetical protein